mmetsp:Transcript_40572/g.73015  ORF Transcript_40572/g.73015 Transcript_40572/m.73015 type:complete len:541 (-) Transcript_40572:108-1730(-)|eukprot:CAMPEP_0197641694 /NCGR_PEP_ID=MMETSP1338-20131121/15587_1 /TAXON_ID=43686 ORGANISM="Pelagodinium beii, Strain RCC1491" /NCGR_SAMPLE_ID=MMETSP1338 /ASSEMBLY_ACC=CAM_ASM_000754 /LENGTH=540 /DNA_ID=CAMNT_0043214723 /DNA_START=98 /DNA_END=1720 /DNA_ORIENTATION=-
MTQLRQVSELFAQVAESRNEEKKSLVSAEKARRSARRKEAIRVQDQKVEARGAELERWAALRKAHLEEAKALLGSKQQQLAEKVQLIRQQELAVADKVMETEAERKRNADIVREQQKRPRTKSVEPKNTLPQDQVKAMSKLMNEALAKLYPLPEERKWSKLFRYLDDAGNGAIGYEELQRAVREVLKMSKDKVPEEKLRALWGTLDGDSSGIIAIGEFGKFMRLQEERQVAAKEGAAAHAVAEAKAASTHKVRSERESGMLLVRKEKVSAQQALTARAASLRESLPAAAAAAMARKVEQRRQGAMTAREERDRMLHRNNFAIPVAKGIPAASLELQKRMATQFLQKATALGMAWSALFSYMDLDGSGLVSYEEFSGMVRDRLGLQPSQFSDVDLKSIWAVLDGKNSGKISKAEFGSFMMLGNHIFDAQRAAKAEQKLAAVEDKAAKSKRLRKLMEEKVLEAKAQEARSARKQAAALREAAQRAAEEAARNAEEDRKQKADATRRRLEEEASELRMLAEEARKGTARAQLEQRQVEKASSK